MAKRQRFVPAPHVEPYSRQNSAFCTFAEHPAGRVDERVFDSWSLREPFTGPMPAISRVQDLPDGFARFEERDRHERQDGVVCLVGLNDLCIVDVDNRYLQPRMVDELAREQVGRQDEVDFELDRGSRDAVEPVRTVVEPKAERGNDTVQSLCGR